MTYAILCHRSNMNLLDAAWMIGSIFQPPIFVVIAGALFFRRGTTAGAWACLLIGIGYAAIGAFGGWAALGDRLGLADTPPFAWDHTKPPTRALVGMPLSAPSWTSRFARPWSPPLAMLHTVFKASSMGPL